MNASLPVFHKDRSDGQNLFFERDGKRVPLEEVFSTGFIVTENDTAAVLTLVKQHLVNVDEFQK